MSWLALLLSIKIIVTAVLVALPFLFAPLPRLVAATRVATESGLLFRLYGVAIAALLVSYGFGLAAAQGGVFPWGVVWMGLVSNAGAALLLLRLTKPWTSGFWQGGFFALVAVGLAVAAAMPGQALDRVW